MIFLSKCFLRKRKTYPSPSYIIGVGPATWWLEDNFRVKSAIPRSLLVERLVQFLRSIQGTLKVPTSMANLANPAVFCWLAYSYFSMNISALYIYVCVYICVCVALLYLPLSLFTANAWEVVVYSIQSVAAAAISHQIHRVPLAFTISWKSCRAWRHCPPSKQLSAALKLGTWEGLQDFLTNWDVKDVQ